MSTVLSTYLSSNFCLGLCGIETSLIYDGGLELPQFASCIALQSDKGRQFLKQIFIACANIARTNNAQFYILETPTWRASWNWGQKIGLTREETMDLNRDAGAMLQEVKKELELCKDMPKMVVAGLVGPSCDAYKTINHLSVSEACQYHMEQMNVLKETGCDFVIAYTLTYIQEAMGVVKAAIEVGVDIAVFFTTETDGKLPSGETLQTAIKTIDKETIAKPIYYGINCAHPDHFGPTLLRDKNQDYVKRLRGLRVNPSKKSHAELDNSSELDVGDHAELAEKVAELRRNLPLLSFFGACCGSSPIHIEHIGNAISKLYL